MSKNNGMVIFDLDMYSNRISFFYNNRERIGSGLGLLLTLIYIILSIIIFIFYSISTIKRNEMRVYDSYIFSNDTPSIEINSGNMYFVFGIEDRISSNRFVDPSIYYPEVLFLDRVKKEGGEFQTVERKELKYDRCSIDDFGDDYKLLFGNIEMNNSYCLKDFNITLSGGYKYNRMSYIRIKIVPCVNKSTNHFICKPKEVIDNYLTGTYLSVMLRDIGLNPSNYSIPILPTLQNLYTTIDKRIFRDYILNFGITEIQTDTGLFYENLSSKKYMQFISEQQSFYFRSEEEYNQGKQLSVIQIRLTDSIHIQRRSYKKIQEVFSLIGGYMQLISTVFTLISILCNLDLEVKILNNLFNFNLKTNKITIKIDNIKDFYSNKYQKYMNYQYTSKKSILINRIKNNYSNNINNNNINNNSSGISATKKNLIGIDNNTNSRNILPIINIVNYNKIDDDGMDNCQKIINNNISLENNRKSLFHNQFRNEKINEIKLRAKSLRGDEKIYYRPIRLFTNSFHKTKKNNEDDNNIHLNLFNYYCLANIYKNKKKIELFDFGASLYKKRMDIINVFTILLLSEKYMIKSDKQNNFSFNQENESIPHFYI